ncbi:FIG00857466: hypothetical protein [hydrothermal vent metagenome]|uniref:Uncharacterized protein n=1 Tax=hydrothermal vent metagenome TaxID=652676 RepID=A0A3B0Z2J7_9ZZZZ
MTDVGEAALAQFSEEHHIDRLTQGSLQALFAQKQGYTIDKAKRFVKFQQRIDQELLTHPVILNNEYCKWFQEGSQSIAQIKAFIIQFSVFSNLFLLAQLNKMINADSLENMRASKEILANEIGVIFNSGRTTRKADTDIEKEGDPDLVSTEGSVEGGRFRFRAAHFEWLLQMGEKMDLGFTDMGKRHHGTVNTLFFCDELERLYGGTDYMSSQAASYAVENWAAAGFWDQLVNGFRLFNDRTSMQLPLSFFTWHSRIEAQHAAHTQEELEELYFSRKIDEDNFIKKGWEMLDGVQFFWVGLNEKRLAE